MPEFPSKLFFFCEVEPTSDGETPIILSHIIYDKMKDKYPDFVEKLESHGLIYTRVLGEDDDPSSPIGRGWKSTFLTQDKTIAEERLVNKIPCFNLFHHSNYFTHMSTILNILILDFWFNSSCPLLYFSYLLL